MIDGLNKEKETDKDAKIKELSKVIVALKVKIQQLGYDVERYKEHESENTKLREENNQLQKLLRTQNNDILALKEIQPEITKLQNKINQLKKQLEQKNFEIQRLNSMDYPKEIEQLTKKIAALQIELETTKANNINSVFQQKIVELQKLLTKAHSEGNTKDTFIIELQTTIGKLEKELQEISSKHAKSEVVQTL